MDRLAQAAEEDESGTKLVQAMPFPPSLTLPCSRVLPGVFVLWLSHSTPQPGQLSEPCACCFSVGVAQVPLRGAQASDVEPTIWNIKPPDPALLATLHEGDYAGSIGSRGT